MKKFPLLFDIVSFSMSRCSTCIQWRTNGLPGAALALRDLVLVVREDEVDARRSGGRTSRPGTSCSWPSTRCASPGGPRPKGASHCAQAGSSRLGLPEHEVARVLLVVLVGVHARPRLDPRDVEPRQPAVLREATRCGSRRCRRRCRCGPRAVRRSMSVDHLRDVLGGAGHELGPLHPERVPCPPRRPRMYSAGEGREVAAPPPPPAG